MIVVDASVVVSALVDSGPDGSWADEILEEHDLAAPHHVLVESMNILRRALISEQISSDIASMAKGDLMALRIELFAFEPFADRVWELRHETTAYDAWYVALAETLQEPLATLDLRLTRTSSARCRFLTP